MKKKRVRIGGEEFEIPSFRYRGVIIAVVILIVAVSFAMSFYSVDANENGVVLRFGKYHKTTYPGLHLKLPWGIDKIYKVKVDYQFKEEFGFRTVKPGVVTQYSPDQFVEESWMLTGDLNIADVQWVVQYRIREPFKYLFNVRDINGTIRDVSEAALRFVVGDHSFHEVLQSDRREIANLAKEFIQSTLDLYDSGIKVEMVQLKDVHPPGPVRDSFNEVNKAKQEQETAINEAMQVYNREIYRVEGEAERMIREARGDSINRVNRARGDAHLFTSIYEEYRKSKDVTRQRLYLETIEEIMKKVDKKYIMDEDLQNFIPLLDFSGRRATK